MEEVVEEETVGEEVEEVEETEVVVYVDESAAAERAAAAEAAAAAAGGKRRGHTCWRQSESGSKASDCVVISTRQSSGATKETCAKSIAISLKLGRQTGSHVSSSRNEADELTVFMMSSRSCWWSGVFFGRSSCTRKPRASSTPKSSAVGRVAASSRPSSARVAAGMRRHGVACSSIVGSPLPSRISERSTRSVPPRRPRRSKEAFRWKIFSTLPVRMEMICACKKLSWRAM